MKTFETMNTNTLKSGLMAVMVVSAMLISGVAFAGSAMASHSDNSTEVTVDPNNADPANGTYGTIQNAVENVSAGAHINVTPGDYSEDIVLTTDDLHITSTNGDAVNLTGSVDIQVDTYTLGDNVNAQTGTAEVDPDNVDEANGVYGNVSDALNNSAWGYTVVLNGSEFNESVTIEYDYITFESANNNETTYTGEIDSSNVKNFSLGENVTLNLDSDGGSFAGIDTSDINLMEDTLMGVPLFLWLILALVIGFVYYREEVDN